MRVKRRTSCKTVFLFGKQFFQLGVFLCPFCLFLIESVCKTAPANVLGKNLLFCLGCISALCFKLLYKLDRFDIRLIPCLFTVRQVKAVANHKVSALGLLGGLLRDLLGDFLVQSLGFGS